MMNTRVGPTDTFESVIRTYFATNNLFINDERVAELEYIINVTVPFVEENLDPNIHPAIYGFTGFLVFCILFSVVSVIYYDLNPEPNENGLTDSRQSLGSTNIGTTASEFAESRISFNEVNTTEASCTKINDLMSSPYSGVDTSMPSSSSSDPWTPPPSSDTDNRTPPSSDGFTSSPSSSDVEHSTPSLSTGKPFTPSPSDEKPFIEKPSPSPSGEEPFTPLLSADDGPSTPSYFADVESMTTSFSADEQFATTSISAKENSTSPYLSQVAESATTSVSNDKRLTRSTSSGKEPNAMTSSSNTKQSTQSTTSHVETLMAPSVPLDSRKADSTNRDVLRNPYYDECLKPFYETSRQINPFEEAFKRANKSVNSITLIEMEEYKIMSSESLASEFSLSGGMIDSPHTEINWRSPLSREVISWRTPPSLQTKTTTWSTPESVSDKENANISYTAIEELKKS